MFAYCRNNPIRRVDISGAADADCFDEDGKILSSDEIEGRQGGGWGSSGGGNGYFDAQQAMLDVFYGHYSPYIEGLNGKGNGLSEFPQNAFAKGSSRLGETPKNSTPETVYIQYSDQGDVRLMTLYDGKTYRAMRIDYDHAHGGINGPHVHLFHTFSIGGNTYWNQGPVVAIK